MTDNPLHHYGHVTVVKGDRGSDLVKIGDVAITAAETYFAVAHMARIQHERFGQDDNASLSILGDLLEIDIEDPPKIIKRAARAIDKKWVAVRLVLHQHRRQGACTNGDYGKILAY